MKEERASVQEAAKWASTYLKRSVTQSNISYLIQYARIRKYADDKGRIVISIPELKYYYDEILSRKEGDWKEKLGEDLIWALSFDHLSEKERTKHVHRLHPYKGKFIPQLVEYFLDDQTDEFKKKPFFKPGDVILDPFMGSGTTLIQAAELGMHSIGIDVSGFNCMISGVKSADLELFNVSYILQSALKSTQEFSRKTFDDTLENELRDNMSGFNKLHFPKDEFKRKVRKNEINVDAYVKEKVSLFLKQNKSLIDKKKRIERAKSKKKKEENDFLSTWYTDRIRRELLHYIDFINKIDDEMTSSLMRVIISRTARSCRATTHSDLATLREPRKEPYYCTKHYKICTPINSILQRLKNYTDDTVNRLDEYGRLKKKVYTAILHGDSRAVDIFKMVKKQDPVFFKYLNRRKVSGIFSSPPYVGQIDYHEQHAYAYELFDIERKDDSEIGPLWRGKGKQAQEEYVTGISDVLLNVCKFIRKKGDIFLVANDKFDLYPRIAERSKMRIVKEYKRPVLNRTERDRQPYAEIIFHMRMK